MGKRIGLSRDPQRTPMECDPGPHAGFSSHTAPRLWLPVSSNHRQVNVETGMADPHSMLNLCRRLIADRKSSPALISGDFTILEDALNLAGQPCNVPFGKYGAGNVILNTGLDRQGPVDLENLHLEANEGVIVELE